MAAMALCACAAMAREPAESARIDAPHITPTVPPPIAQQQLGTKEPPIAEPWPMAVGARTSMRMTPGNFELLIDERSKGCFVRRLYGSELELRIGIDPQRREGYLMIGFLRTETEKRDDPIRPVDGRIQFDTDAPRAIKLTPFAVAGDATEYLRGPLPIAQLPKLIAKQELRLYEAGTKDPIALPVEGDEAAARSLILCQADIDARMKRAGGGALPDDAGHFDGVHSYARVGPWTIDILAARGCTAYTDFQDGMRLTIGVDRQNSDIYFALNNPGWPLKPGNRYRVVIEGGQASVITADVEAQTETDGSPTISMWISDHAALLIHVSSAPVLRVSIDGRPFRLRMANAGEMFRKLRACERPAERAIGDTPASGAGSDSLPLVTQKPTDAARETEPGIKPSRKRAAPLENSVRPYANLGNWRVMIDGSAEDGCFALKAFADNSVMRLGFEAKSATAYMTIGNPGWKTVLGQRYDMVLQFDDEVPFNNVAKGINFGRDGEAVFLLAVIGRPDFWSDFMGRKNLRINIGPHEARLDLDGSDVAGEAVLRCQNWVARGKEGPTPAEQQDAEAHAALPGVAAPLPPLPTLGRQMEAFAAFGPWAVIVDLSVAGGTCHLVRVFDDGMTMRVDYRPAEKRGYALFTNDAWKLIEGSSHRLSLRFDTGPPWTSPAGAVKMANGLWLAVPLPGDAFIRNLTSAGKLTVGLDGREADYNLTGAIGGWREVLHCQERLAREQARQ